MKKWRCQVCNYVHSGDELPESCPVCGIYRDRFELVSDEGEETKKDLKETAGEAPADKKTYKCSVCGYFHREDDPPDKCPVCGAESENFKVLTSPSDVIEAEAGEPDAADKKWKCTVCGYIHTGPTPPDKCPVCGADRSLFVLLPAEEAEPMKKPAPQAVEKTQSIESSPADASTPEDDTAMPEPSTEPSPVSRAYASITNLMAKLHGHPISVHIPNGVLPVAFLFLLLGIVFDSDKLLLVSHYNLIFVLLTMPLVLFSGYNDWQLRLGGAMTRVIKTKMICGGTVTVLALILVAWRVIDPGVLDPWSSDRFIYVAVFLIALVAAAVAGFYGGKLIQFPGDDKL